MWKKPMQYKGGFPYPKDKDLVFVLQDHEARLFILCRWCSYDGDWYDASPWDYARDEGMSVVAWATLDEVCAYAWGDECNYMWGDPIYINS